MIFEQSFFIPIYTFYLSIIYSILNNSNYTQYSILFLMGIYTLFVPIDVNFLMYVNFLMCVMSPNFLMNATMIDVQISNVVHLIMDALIQNLFNHLHNHKEIVSYNNLELNKDSLIYYGIDILEGYVLFFIWNLFWILELCIKCLWFVYLYSIIIGKKDD